MAQTLLQWGPQVAGRIGREPSAGVAYFPSHPPPNYPHYLPAFSCFDSLGM